MDGNVKAFFIDSATVVSEAMSELCLKIGLKDPRGWAMFISYNNVTRGIAEGERLSDILAKYEILRAKMQNNGKMLIARFIVKKQIILEPTRAEVDPVAFHLLYHQAARDIVSGRLPCGEQEAKLFAATKLQHDVGNFDSSRNIDGLLNTIISARHLTSHPKAEWAKMILAEHHKLNGKGKDQCERLYMDMARTLKYYGSNIFPVKFDTESLTNQLWKDLPPRFDIAVNCDGIFFINKDTRAELKAYTFLQILNWSWKPGRFEMSLYENNIPKNIAVSTPVPDDIQLTLLAYSNYLKNNSKYARVNENYSTDDPEVLVISKGDIIVIKEKVDEDWYYGECKNIRGMFPADKVTLLYRSPDTKSLMEQQSTPTRENRRERTATRVKSTYQKSGTNPMLTWAQIHFAKNNTIRRSKTTLSAEQLTKYSSEPVVAPLHTFPGKSRAEQTVLSKAALDCFQGVMKFMDDLPSSKRSKVSLAQEIVQRGIEEFALRDEIVCQIVKQVTQHPKLPRKKKGYNLLAMCLTCFIPSAELIPYLSVFLESRTGDPDIGTMAADCLARLKKTEEVGERVWAPSQAEMNAIIGESPVMVRVVLPDANGKAIHVTSHTTVTEATALLVSRLQLPEEFTENWGLFETIGTDCSPLSESYMICDVMSAWEIGSCKASRNAKRLRETYKQKAYWRVSQIYGQASSNDKFGLSFRKKLWLDEFSEQDIIQTPAVSNFYYLQIMDDIIQGRLPLSVQVACEYAALAVSYKLGTDNISGSDVMNYLPRHLLSSKKPAEWLELVSEAIFAIGNGATGMSAYRSFLSKFLNSKLYGGTAFYVTQKDRNSSIPSKILMIINIHGISIFAPLQTEPTIFWSYDQISQWSPTTDGWLMVVGDLFKPEKYSFQSPYANEMMDLYMAYMLNFEN
eukprot:TRINITY_DN7290_c0_g1_i1.p1 TRINITY_DN7290_c0_g1~~TRINITY_DN7290_c0_g1_i1.p1  ORF type:complete len:1026 (+),score=139.51 TRINITY_DN7290_c0_g1_i1:354-3080(+)